ncbi:uncharacterized protein N7484_002770 [Penicillium longicatenatum]|uniref:uncharacterized protein n=1 Tax=Penicillium longicatenatum TaxID=1561947 RepID=UPI0025471E63|nr:uncharacterized protein N7484_002770 [Penicillium longicatenatum]KAJ5649047.1 hypothetical protein N7484_002770 [Penicillium longicatenatum]
MVLLLSNFSFFAIYLALGVVLCWRHGFRRSDGWILVVTLSILRVLAASFQLATINTPNTTTYGGALICQGIGLGPLILLNLGLFIRMNMYFKKIHRLVFTAISVVSIAAIAIAVYGGTESAESASLGTNAMLKVSVILFTACYIAFWGLFIYFIGDRKLLPEAEQKMFLCLPICAPFMIHLGDYVPSLRAHFSVLTGDVTTFLCMDVLEEIVVVAVYVFFGMGLEQLSPEMKGTKRRNDSEVTVVLNIIDDQ